MQSKSLYGFQFAKVVLALWCIASFSSTSTQAKDQNAVGHRHRSPRDSEMPQGPDNSACIQEAKSKVHAIILDVVKNALRRYVWSVDSRQRFATQVATKIAAQMDNFMTKGEPKQIPLSIKLAICSEAEHLPLNSIVVRGLCEASRPLLDKSGLAGGMQDICRKHQGCCSSSEGEPEGAQDEVEEASD